MQIYHLAKIITSTMRILTRLCAVIEEPGRIYLAETNTDGAAVARLRRRRLTDDEWSIPALGAIAIMSFGGIYFMETERIWLFAMPWVAGLSVASMTVTSNSMRLLLGAGLIQMFMMETLLFTLW